MAGIPSEHARDVREALRSVASDPDLGAATLSDAAALSNLLKDLLPDAPREKNLLVSAAEARLPAMMLDHVGQGIDASSAIRLAAASFGANTHFSPEACAWVATEFAVALNLADGLATDRSELPPGDITTARADHAEALLARAASGDAGTGQLATARAVADGSETAGAADQALPTGQVSLGGAERPPDLVMRRPASGIPAAAGSLPVGLVAGQRRNFRVGTLVAGAGSVIVLISFLVPLYKNPYVGSAVHVWGGSPWYVASGPTASLLIAVIAAILSLGRAGRVLAAAACAALIACGVQLTFEFQSVWQWVSANGDRMGVGVPLGMAGAALLVIGATTGLVRLMRADPAG